MWVMGHLPAACVGTAAQIRLPGAGWETSDDDDAYSNACRLERRPEIQDRIAFFTKQAEERVIDRRKTLEYPRKQHRRLLRRL